ncbi:thioredoxin family protein [Listeria grayi]|uniref:Thioredoxin n=1 Tax=Listeria grayi FSL F6-1183 TaxID=1265827 RepID=A0A829R6K1_LISGR|nr:thioredoxin family protein [Listeria grayi]EUJ28637.1 thioredoxin 1 [Listeria grayi FSL F6-1183]
MAILHAKKENFEEILENHPLILLNFWAEWCAPCRAFIETLVTLDENEPVQVVKINTQREEELMERFEVQGLPYSIILKNGKKNRGDQRKMQL